MKRVRFAPSPTGWHHVGGARTALFNWLYARKGEGKFILRIEDTDLERSEENYTESIKEDMDWLGITWDEFYRQSDRLEIYKRYARKLMQEGKAYKCYCTEEELKERKQKALEEDRAPAYDGRCRDLTEEEKEEFEQQGREPVIRFKLPEEEPEVTVPDLIKGDVHFERVMTGDFVIIKSDGTPSYNFACTLDDYLMEISHVLRAEDHLSNTPKQMMLYDALGFEQPEFGHFSMLLDSDKKKLSKRSGATSVKKFREQGYLPEALNNHLALLGWSPKDEREIFSREQLVEEFSLEGVVDSPQVFDRKKMDWFNNTYMKEMDIEGFTERAFPFLVEEGVVSEDLSDKERGKLREVLDLIRPSADNLVELSKHKYLDIFYDSIEESEEAKEVLSWDNSSAVLESLIDLLKERTEVTDEDVTEIVRQVKEELSVGYKEVYKPLRAAVTGMVSGPEIKEVISILGAEETVGRIEGSL